MGRHQELGKVGQKLRSRMKQLKPETGFQWFPCFLGGWLQRKTQVRIHQFGYTYLCGALPLYLSGAHLFGFDSRDCEKGECKLS